MRKGEIPLDLVADILSRLRVKDVLRFRLVDRDFCDLIDSPHFVKMHLMRSIAGRAEVHLMYQFLADLYSSDLNSLSTYSSHSLHCRIPFKRYLFMDLVGSCNGLLLIKLHFFDETPVVALFNPWTRRERHLRSSRFDRFARLHYTVEHGLGYDSARDDYKVLEIVEFRLVKSSRATLANVYSLTRNTWRAVQAFTDNFSSHGLWACEVGGALHNLGWMEGGETVQHSVRAIAAFHVSSEEFRFVPLPDYQQDYLGMAVAELGGCLCLACHYKLDSNYRVDVWVMKEYGVGDSWTELISVTLPVIEEPIPLPVPVAYSTRGDMILFNCTASRFFWYDMKRRPNFLDLRAFSEPHGCYEECLCVGSLVPLNGRGRDYDHNVVLSHHPNEEEAQSHWLPPPKRWIKVNCAGDWDSHGGSAGVVARDMHGNVLFFKAKKFRCASAVFAEATALQEAVSAAYTAGAVKVMVELDSKDIMTALNSNLLCCDRGGIEPILVHVMSISSWLKEVSFTYVKRSTNQAARWVSSQAKVNAISVGWAARAPPGLEALCLADIEPQVLTQSQCSRQDASEIDGVHVDLPSAAEI
ncbi:hypothetical protein RJ639_022638 [Escallonia herrerae]|uniref:F-box domain-containing protein n=1 Tax=Escallonia herrerae TaxID=1293975 RepID=A0AA88V1F5_9ASTE|nr:hypothetical protein RJ639_022638 [Escallonia herrerae]